MPNFRKPLLLRSAWKEAAYVLVLLSTMARGQTVSQTMPADALSSPSASELLNQTAVLYARPGKFHISSVNEARRASELMDMRSESLWSIEYGSGNRWRIETRSPQGSWVNVSDGNTDGKYWIEAKRYEQHAAGVVPSHYSGYFGGNVELMNAANAALNLETMATKVLNPERLPDDTITIEGQHIECYVVKAESDFNDKEAHIVDTMWIDKKTHLIRKVFEDSHTYTIDGEIHTPFAQTETMIFPVMELDAPAPDPEFAFTPPAGTKLVDTMEPERARPKRANHTMEPTATSTMDSKAVADAPLVDSDGKVKTLQGYRGKVVLIDLWATWCGPCVAAMPGFAAMAESLKATDLMILSVDEDEDSQTAMNYLKLHGYSWTDLHDPKSRLQKALNIAGIPETILLDRDGNVLFSESVVEGGTAFEAKLRDAIAKALPAHR